MAPALRRSYLPIRLLRDTLSNLTISGPASHPNEISMMDAMDDAITIETDIFEHKAVKPHFINDCCFGEDFAAWLLRELSLLAESGFTFSEPIQEDYGWGFWATNGKDPFWIALSYVGDGPQEPPAQWVVSVTYDAGLNLVKRLFHKPDSKAFEQLRDRVWQVLKLNSAIKLIESPKS
jgi:hypothetical protein